jgi:hypothetical protein
MSKKQIIMLIGALLVIGIGIIVTILAYIDQPLTTGYGGAKRKSTVLFTTNAYAITVQLKEYAPKVLEYYGVPVDMGGAGANLKNVTIPKLAMFLGFTDKNYSLKSEYGEFRIIKITGSLVTLKGVGIREINKIHPICTTFIDLQTSEITTTNSKGTGF